MFSGLSVEGLSSTAPLPFDGGRNGFTNILAITAIPALILARLTDREIFLIAHWANVSPFLLCRNNLIEEVANVEFFKFR